MNFLTKYLLLFIVLISSVKFGSAQDSSKTKPTGEIVMTKAELQSFLNKIAELKKQHIARKETAKQKRELKLQDLNEVYKSKDVPGNNPVRPASIGYRNEEFSTPVQQYNSLSEQQLFKELELINARLSSLMLQMEVLKINAQLNESTTSPTSMPPARNSMQRQPQIRIVPEQQPIIIQQESPPQVYVNPGLQRNPSSGIRPGQSEQTQEEQPNEALLLARQNEQLILRSRIKSLEDEMSLSQQLLKGAGEDEKNNYNEDIANLTAQIDSLSLQLEQSSREADSLRMKKQNNLSDLLNDFSYNVYFKNNSTMIPSSDYSKLQEIVNIAEEHPQATVVLRGFASKSGKPQYNNKISFQRAAGVKKWLLDNGLDLKDIVTMSHGVDQSVDAARARRVEITFRAQ